MSTPSKSSIGQKLPVTQDARLLENVGFNTPSTPASARRDRSRLQPDWNYKGQHQTWQSPGGPAMAPSMAPSMPPYMAPNIMDDRTWAMVAGSHNDRNTAYTAVAGQVQHMGPSIAEPGIEPPSMSKAEPAIFQAGMNVNEAAYTATQDSHTLPLRPPMTAAAAPRNQNKTKKMPARPHRPYGPDTATSKNLGYQAAPTQSYMGAAAPIGVSPSQGTPYHHHYNNTMTRNTGYEAQSMQPWMMAPPPTNRRSNATPSRSTPGYVSSNDFLVGNVPYQAQPFGTAPYNDNRYNATPARAGLHYPNPVPANAMEAEVGHQPGRPTQRSTAAAAGSKKHTGREVPARNTSHYHQSNAAADTMINTMAQPIQSSMAAATESSDRRSHAGPAQATFHPNPEAPSFTSSSQNIPHHHAAQMHLPVQYPITRQDQARLYLVTLHDDRKVIVDHLCKASDRLNALKARLREIEIQNEKDNEPNNNLGEIYPLLFELQDLRKEVVSWTDEYKMNRANEQDMHAEIAMGPRPVFGNEPVVPRPVTTRPAVQRQPVATTPVVLTKDTGPKTSKFGAVGDNRPTTGSSGSGNRGTGLGGSFSAVPWC